MSTPVVYRMYDADELLLYIGCSSRGLDRLEEHCGKEWWTEVDIVTVEHFESNEPAAEAERLAIFTESPKFNIRMNNRPRRTKQVISATAAGRSVLGQELWEVTTADESVFNVWAGTKKVAIERVRRQVLNRYTSAEELMQFPVVDTRPMIAKKAA